MGKRADTGAEGNLHAAGNCHSSALFTPRLPRSPWSIHRLIISRQIYFRGAQDAFAGCHKPHGGHLHARPLKVPTVDRLLDVDIRVAADVAHQIAQSGEARTKVFLRIGESEEGPIFPRVVDRTGERRSARLDAIESESKYVGVSVNQSWKHGGLAEVEHLRIRRDLHRIG